MRNRLRKVFTWLNVIVVVFTLLAYYAPGVSPTSFWPLTLIGTSYPWLLLLNLVCIGFWIFLRKWHFLISALTLLIGWSHLTAFVGMHPFSTNTADQPTALKIMTFNAGAFYFLYKANPKKIAKPFFEFLKEEQPDIACFQEFTYRGSQFEDRKDSLKVWGGFKYFKFSTNKQMIIASKYPIVESGFLKFDRSNNGALYADIAVSDATIRVYNLHLQSNQITPQAEKLAETGDLQEKETWLEIGSILNKNRTASKKRADQADEVRQHMDKSPYQVMVCGDFNDTPNTYTYAKIAEGKMDSFKQGGFGIGTTYAGRIPALRIDYILSEFGKGFVNTKVHRKKFSDHYPVTAVLMTE
ncbi:MAG: endonuclease/exonuclease/phosphatase family protein [Saprospiraceae bacterium]|nr:endonuclease/exonuclease/phosphatase family protein [Saprospiraceae bacterium]